MSKLPLVVSILGLMVASSCLDDVPCDGACGVDEVCERIVPCGPFGWLDADRLDDCVATTICVGDLYSCDCWRDDEEISCVETERADGTMQLSLIVEGYDCRD